VGGRGSGLAIVTLVLSASVEARAQGTVTGTGLPVSFQADEVRLDARNQGLEVSGNVRVEEPPFFLTSDALRLRRVPIGVELEGAGKAAFCPCLGAPLAVRFRDATVAPPHDLILRQPVLEVFGVPVAWAPIFWLRSPGRIGLLPPEVAWRGSDGLFAGEGVHIPWVNGDVAHGLDLRAGGYFEGGVDVRAVLRTPETETYLRWDWLRGSGGLDAFLHGATLRPSDVSVAWDLDALRGARAVASTTDVQVAAFPFDRGDAQAVWSPDGWVLASGVRAVSIRGADLFEQVSAGPVVTARRGDALGNVGAYDATFEGGAVTTTGLATTSFARTDLTASVAGRANPLLFTASGRAYGDIADTGYATGLDGAVEARAGAGVPLVRAYDSGEANDPWLHRTEPRLEAAAIALHESAVFVVPAARGMQTPNGGAWIAAATWANVLGRWGSRGAAEVDLSGGGVGDASATDLALRARAVVTSDWFGLRGDVARVFGPSDGGAAVGQARVGPATWLHVSAHLAERDGVDPLIARTLADAPLEPATGFLSMTGWTGGGSVVLPLGDRITARAGADADLSARDLVAELGAIELHDPCGCVVVRAIASHRIGRAGVDAWVTVDLPTVR
jgi:hypothetical protein